ncbi:MAG TPA: 4-hydroxy-tetrahydrodipicolinate synthase [Bacteroidales bacterium]|nr:4-hydroxy-tetrahydrodipicolinate synthase [Bacteroidales bacterium]HRZ76664.1 4-hydroxy-tetrahydrodipicolinate synthase [Bacteroidales bacterium]
MIQLSGTGVALVTPFYPDGRIDYDSLTRLVQHVTEGGVEFLVVLGTTGESVTLSPEERREVTEHVLGVNASRLPVVLGVGGNNTSEVVRTLNAMDPKGISAVLSVSPYYNKPQQEGIFQHFKAVAEASPLPVIIYNVPSRTSSNISASTTLRLAREVPGIIGVKEASGNMVQCMEILRDRPQGFLVLSGDDVLTMPLVALGADGVISVVANPYPRQFSEMVRLERQGKTPDARAIHYRLLEFIELLFADGNPSGAKAALEVLGICGNHLRLPLVQVTHGVYQQLVRCMAQLA